MKGKITKQTFEHYTLKYEIAENVLGEKKILVSDVVEIIRDDVSDKDYQRIKALFPTSDFLNLNDYETITKNYFDKFYADHPTSKHTPNIERLQNELNKEYENLKNGGVKINGKLLNKGQVDANKYEVEAILLLREIEHDIKKKQYISALRVFEAMEKHYTHTRPYLKAVTAVHKIFPDFIANLTDLSNSVEAELKKKQKYIERLPSTEVKRVTVLLQKDITDYQASLLRAEEKLKTKWLPLNKYEKEPIDEVLKHAIAEQKRLEKLSEKEFEDGGKIYRSILEAINKKDHDTGNKLLGEFQRLNPPQSDIDQLKSAILSTKDDAEARQERQKQANLKAAKEKAAADAARKKAESEAKQKSKDKKSKGKSAEDKIKDKLNISQKEKILREAEKLLEHGEH